MNQAPALGLRTLASASLAFLTGGVASKALSLITVPILARLLTPVELGLLDIGAGVAATVTTLAVLGSDNAVARFLSDDRRPSAVWGAAAVVVAGSSVALLLFVLVGQAPLAGLLVGSSQRGDIIVAALFHGIATAVFVSALNVIRLTQAPNRYAMATTSTIIAQSIGGVVAALVLRNPIVGILAWWGLVALVSGAVILMTGRPPTSRPDRERVAHLARFGAPLVPGVIAWTIGDLGIRAAVAHADLNSLGSYSIASRLVSVVALLIAGFSIAWIPYVVGTAKRSDDAAFRDGATAMMLVVGLVAVGLAALAPELVVLIGGERYRSAEMSVAPLAAGMMSFGAISVLAGAAAVQLKTTALAWGSVIGMAVQVGLAVVLATPLLLVGAGVASAVGYAVAAILVASRVHLRGLIGVRTVAIAAGALLALAIEWLMVLAGAPISVRLLTLGLVLLSGLAVYGRTLLAAWSR